jgi:hypothetical protein
MILSEKNIDFLENQIPELAELALQQAYWQTLSSGNSVTVLEDNEIIEISPEGSKKVIKTLIRHENKVTQRHYTIPYKQ